MPVARVHARFSGEVYFFLSFHPFFLWSLLLTLRYLYNCILSVIIRVCDEERKDTDPLRSVREVYATIIAVL